MINYIYGVLENFKWNIFNVLKTVMFYYFNSKYFQNKRFKKQGSR